MRYIISITSIALIALLSFELSTASAVANQTVSGETRINVVKKQPALSPRVQLITLKRALAEAKRKVTLLKAQIAALKKQIEQKKKRGQVVTTYEKRLNLLIGQLSQAEQKVSDLQKKIDAMNSTGSGATQGI